MARSYSQDLRDRVIEATESGTSARKAAARFEVAASSLGICHEALDMRAKGLFGVLALPSSAEQPSLHAEVAPRPFVVSHSA